MSKIIRWQSFFPNRVYSLDSLDSSWWIREIEGLIERLRFWRDWKAFGEKSYCITVESSFVQDQLNYGVRYVGDTRKGRTGKSVSS